MLHLSDSIIAQALHSNQSELFCDSLRVFAPWRGFRVVWTSARCSLTLQTVLIGSFLPVESMNVPAKQAAQVEDPAAKLLSLQVC